MFTLSARAFSPEQFLQHYWQKKPVVIRQGFEHFQDPISADEIAGLAGEDLVESRLVYQINDQWQAEFGPFQHFEHLGDSNWSLIVQALDHWSEEAALLLEPFRFIPNWRLDDLMVSFATPGGGVGPHIDLYDVFICQGSGKRHWRVGDKGNHRQFAAHDALLHVEPFAAIIEVELLPGDILYIPPGFPHEGITVETSLSFSVGFRTNSTESLFSGLADHLIDQDIAGELIEDPDRVICSGPGAIDSTDFQLIKNQLQQVISNEVILRQFIGCFLSQAKHELDLLVADPVFMAQDIQEIIAQQPLMRLGGVRAFYFTETLPGGVCYIDGSEYRFEPGIAPAIKLLCDQAQLLPEETRDWHNNAHFAAFLCRQINAGYWYFAG